jgi:hypothetical protein
MPPVRERFWDARTCSPLGPGAPPGEIFLDWSPDSRFILAMTGQGPKMNLWPTPAPHGGLPRRLPAPSRP